MIKDVRLDLLNSFKIPYKNVFTKYMAYYDNDVPVGYLVYEDLYDRVEIDYIYVIEEYRNKKIASSMLENLIKRINEKGYINITLEVSTQNTYAIKLYEKYGFKTVSIRKNYYKNSDGLLMELKL